MNRGGGKRSARRTSRKRFVGKAALVTLALWAGGAAFATRYRIGIDPQRENCLPGHTLFLIDLHDRSPKKGAMYAFRAQGARPFFPDGTPMVKILAAVPGDRVAIDARGTITVNGERVGAGLPLAGAAGASRFEGRATLGRGRYWFMGTDPSSFDSRYWGTVGDEQIIGRARALY